MLGRCNKGLLGKTFLLSWSFDLRGNYMLLHIMHITAYDCTYLVAYIKFSFL